MNESATGTARTGATEPPRRAASQTVERLAVSGNGDGGRVGVRERLAGLPELRRAVAAIRAGTFRRPQPDGDNDDDGQAGLPRSVWVPAGRVVAVVGAVGSCGATTVAVAVSTALDLPDRPVRLVEAAGGARSGLSAAATAELGEATPGWVRGMRLWVTLDRATSTTARGQAPMPPPSDAAVTVVDAGVSPSLSADPIPWVTAAVAGAHRLVVVAPLSVPGLRRLELTLAEVRLDLASVAVAVVGAARSRWPSVVAAAAGPVTRSVWEAGRGVVVPVDRRLAMTGITPEPLPPSVAAAGRRLVRVLGLGEGDQS